MQADLHVHSRHSQRPSQWLLQKIGCPESFTEPLRLYHLARRRGMDLVTVTDHNRIEGALEIAHLPGVVIGEEVTSYLPEDGCKVHVLVYRISEAQHAEIQKLRPNLYELLGYLRQEGVFHAAAHPFYAVNDRLTPAHIEKLLLLFSVFEINGDSHPEANRRLREMLAALTPQALGQLADRHGIAPVGPLPWVKRLIGGSDDHSSLTIGRTFTRVEGARSAAEFFAGIEAGAAQVIEEPSSPKHLAHNLYSIAYQFYRARLDLGAQVPHDFLLRFVDRSLRGTPEEEEGGILSRLHFLWQARRLRRIRGSLPGPLVDLLRKETARLIRDEPELFALPRRAKQVPQPSAERWFDFIHKMSSRILLGFANHLLDHLSGANLFSIFHTIGSAGGFCTLLAPYFVGFAHHNAQIRLAREAAGQLGAQGAAARPLRCAVFAENAAQGLAAAGGREEAERVVLTCEADTEGGAVRRFAPIGVYAFEELPGERLVYPPLLEMLDFCFSQPIERLHLAGSGPTGLAGLFIGRFLGLPLEATHSEAIPRLARQLTHDTFIEDLAWKYLAWFYGHVRTVYVPSPGVARELMEKGVPAEKIRLEARVRAEDEAAGRRRPVRRAAQGGI